MKLLDAPWKRWWLQRAVAARDARTQGTGTAQPPAAGFSLEPVLRGAGQSHLFPGEQWSAALPSSPCFSPPLWGQFKAGCACPQVKWAEWLGRWTEGAPASCHSRCRPDPGHEASAPPALLPAVGYLELPCAAGHTTQRPRPLSTAWSVETDLASIFFEQILIAYLSTVTWAKTPVPGCLLTDAQRLSILPRPADRTWPQGLFHCIPPCLAQPGASQPSASTPTLRTNASSSLAPSPPHHGRTCPSAFLYCPQKANPFFFSPRNKQGIEAIYLTPSTSAEMKMAKEGMITEIFLSSAELLLEPDWTELPSSSLLQIAAREAATGVPEVTCGRAEPCRSREAPELLRQKDFMTFTEVSSPPLPKPGPWNPPSPAPPTVKKPPRMWKQGLRLGKKFPCRSATALPPSLLAASPHLEHGYGTGRMARREPAPPAHTARLRTLGWQPLRRGLLSVIRGQKRDKGVRSVKLSTADCAVTAWGQWCACRANPWATSRDLDTLEGSNLSDERASSSQKERRGCRAFFTLWLETRAQGRRVAKTVGGIQAHRRLLGMRKQLKEHHQTS